MQSLEGSVRPEVSISIEVSTDGSIDVYRARDPGSSACGGAERIASTLDSRCVSLHDANTECFDFSHCRSILTRFNSATLSCASHLQSRTGPSGVFLSVEEADGSVVREQ